MTGSVGAGATKVARGRRAHGIERRAARLAATQALYQIELGGASADHVVQEFLDHRLEEEIDGLRLAETDRRLLAELVEGVVARRDDLDDMLAAVLDRDWPVERLETLLRIVLRAGAYELSERPGVPARVIITEYLGLADAFFGGKEPGLVNGVLDRLAQTLRPEEFSADAAEPRDARRI